VIWREQFFIKRTSLSINDVVVGCPFTVVHEYPKISSDD
jgi:hypothetical protein